MSSPKRQRMPSVKTIAHYSSPGLIIARLRNREPAAVVGELCSTLQQAGKVNDPLAFFNSVISHEMISSTVISPGWALPHGRGHGAVELSVAVGRSDTPLNWFGAGTEPVHMVFLSVVPEVDSGGYLTLLSGLARLSQAPALLEKLTRAADSQAMFEILQQLPLRQSRPPVGQS